MPDEEEPFSWVDRERFKLEDWLRHVYVDRLHFSETQAQCLILAGADWHQVSSAVRGGCPWSVALDIFT